MKKVSILTLYKELADGKVISEIIDIYPNKPKEKTVSVTEERINTMLGIALPLSKAAEILEKLGFDSTTAGNTIQAKVPSYRLNDITIPEDLVEEIARVYGYHNLPDELPQVTSTAVTQVGSDPFFWEKRVKEAMKYWGFTEVYTYPMVSETMYEGRLEDGVKLKNPLGEEFAYMRMTLIPSLLKVIDENKKQENIKIFEISNIYEKNGNSLPSQKQRFAGAVKQKNASFYEIKGLLEQLGADIGIKNLSFRPASKSGLETEILLGKESIGNIEILDEALINFELHFDALIKYATLHKTFTPLTKYPPVVEDLSLIIDTDVPTGEIREVIQKVSPIIFDVTLFDKYDSSRTFHIVYQDPSKNLTTDEVGKIREKILKVLKEKYNARLKS
jgi:phenylalanyl-tRNA synthetase beta chain